MLYIIMCCIDWGIVHWHFLLVKGTRVITQSLMLCIIRVCVCVCCMKFSLVDDFIFLNLSCIFTVNNCIILFQVAKSQR